MVHGDLKPENILIDSTGHLKLTDFGLSKGGQSEAHRKWIASYLKEESNSDSPAAPEERGRKKKGFIGTPYYVAPETILGQELAPDADWWALGVIMYELMLGEPPYTGDTPDEVFTNILNDAKVHEIPIGYNDDQVTPEAALLITGLLTKDPVQRLGHANVKDIKSHAFFQGLNWDSLRSQEPPFTPKPVDITDTSYFPPEKAFKAPDAQKVSPTAAVQNTSSNLFMETTMECDNNVETTAKGFCDAADNVDERPGAGANE